MRGFDLFNEKYLVLVFVFFMFLFVVSFL